MASVLLAAALGLRGLAACSEHPDESAIRDDAGAGTGGPGKGGTAGQGGASGQSDGCAPDADAPDGMGGSKVTDPAAAQQCDKIDCPGAAPFLTCISENTFCPDAQLTKLDCVRVLGNVPIFCGCLRGNGGHFVWQCWGKCDPPPRPPDPTGGGGFGGGSAGSAAR